MLTREDLVATLRRLDGRGYKAYRDLRGSFAFPGFTLHVDHVQGDPFAAPSLVRARVPMDAARLPAELFEGRVRRIALADFLARQVRRAIRHMRGEAPHAARRAARSEPTGERSKREGFVAIDAGPQEVLERSAVVIDPGWVEARLEVALPAAGRRILGSAAEALLTSVLPSVVEAGLVWSSLPGDEARAFVSCVENQEAMRAQLGARGLVAFVGNGAILPRESGASQRPMAREDALPFRSPPSLEVSLEVPNPVGGARALRGMGVPKGVTLVVGGGYHGKSTLLRALERAVHPHVPGDGREHVVADPRLVKIRAEDGRAVTAADIHGFIDALPALPGATPSDTRRFSTRDASGSTSQAASIVEALEVGATGLLLDEDTSATNFMVRDARMQALVARSHEPITPFIDRVRELYERLGVSTVLVMGGCGDYFDVADTVVMMRDYAPLDATEEARKVSREHGGERRREVAAPLAPARPRVADAASLDASRGRREVRVRARGCDTLSYGVHDVDVRALEQLVETSQLRAVGLAIHLASRRLMDGEATLAQVLDRLEELLDEQGLDVLDPFHRPGSGHHPGNLARPRRFEVAAAVSRLRALRVR